MLGKRFGAFVGVVTAMLMLLPATVAEAAAPAPQPSFPTSAIPTVGVVSVAGYGPVSTGTVINTPKRNIVLVAAHTIDGFYVHPGASAFSFTPGYSPGTTNPTPYGVWQVASYHLMPKRGNISHNPDYDTALLVLEKNNQGRNIQDVVGGQNYQLNAPISGVISSIGYPINGPSPLYCQVYARVHKVNGHKDEFQADCGKSFGDGVSGAPLMTNYNPLTHQGTVIANVGGDNEGGDPSEELTYGVRLDSEFQAFLVGVVNTA